MRAGAAGLRASGARCDLRRRAALPPCRPHSVGRGGSAPSTPRLTRDVGQRPPPICESDRHVKRGAPLWREEERSVRKNEAYWHSFCPPGLPEPATSRLRPRKGNGTRACRDITRSRAPQLGGWVLGKARMVKAGWPEPPVSSGYAVSDGERG